MVIPFSTWNPLQPCEPSNKVLAIAKAVGDDGVPSKKAALKLWAESWLCTEAEDADLDIIPADEVDLAYCKSNGFMCFEHPSLALTLVGRNVHFEKAEHPSGVMGIKQNGYFYGNDPEGKKLYEKMTMLCEAEDDMDRWLGGSAEGKSLAPVPRPKGGHILNKSLIWGTAVTHRPKNKGCRFTPGEYDIACSIHEAANSGRLEDHLRALLHNHSTHRRALEFAKSKSINPQIETLITKYGMSVAQAEEFLVRARAAFG
jgi:hypothetical protein